MQHPQYQKRKPAQILQTSNKTVLAVSNGLEQDTTDGLNLSELGATLSHAEFNGKGKSSIGHNNQLHLQKFWG